VSNIRIDYQHGLRQAVQHLAAFRHKTIAFVAGPTHLKSALARKEAFEKAMGELGLEVAPEMIVVGDHTLEGGMRALEELMRLRKPPTAVLCSNDMTAIGVMREAYDLGLSVPRDLSVVGFDDIRLSEFITPPLTTVQMSQTELARIAFEALMNEVAEETPAGGRREYHLNTNLILRRSTALAPSGATRAKISADRSISLTS
jgi:LacI family transcriptional regulator